MRQGFGVTAFGKTIRYGFEAAAVRALLSGLGRLDLDTVSDLGARLGRWAPRILPRRQKMARDNILRALPGCDADAILDEMWDNLGRTFFEMSKMRLLERDKGAGVVDLRNPDILQDTLARGRGMVLFSAHIANWEMCALPPAMADFDAAMMYRAPNNSRVNQILSQLRPARVAFLEKSRQGTADAFATLKAGKCVGFLIDHRYSKGVKVDFFGRPAYLAPTAALMARKFRCPLVPLRPERIGRGARFRVTAYPPLDVDYDLPPDRFAETVMQQATGMLEGWIRERPAHWFWVQRLWAE